MLLGKGRRRAEQARLRIGDELDRQAGHQVFEAPLGAEAFGKARGEQAVADAQAQPEVGQFVAGWLLIPRGTLSWKSLLYMAQVSLAGALMVACVWLVRDMFIAVPIIVGALAYPALALLLRVVSKDDIELVKRTGRGLFARIRRARTEPA